MGRIYALLTALLLVWNGIAFATPRVLSLSQFCNGSDNIDDTECIRTWIDRAEATGHKDMYVPPGTYLYKTHIPLHSGIHIRCAGPGSAVFRNNGGPGNLFFTDQAIEDVIIENCGFDVNGGMDEFLVVIGVNAASPSKNIHIRGNRIFDSAILGQTSAQERLYILLVPCDNCWVEGNHLSEGGRILVGRPGNRLFIRNNVVDKVNDHAISVVSEGSNTSSDIHVEDNVIFDPIRVGIFFAADGEGETDPGLTTLNVHVARNLIRGDWDGGCIVGTLPANAKRIHVVNNICTKTGASGRFAGGIMISRVNGDHPPAEDVLIGFNTITATDPSFVRELGGIFVKVNHKGLRVIGNEIRNIRGRAMDFRFIDVQEAIVANNVVAGGAMVIDGNFEGAVHDNMLVDSPGLNLWLLADAGETITASVRNNVIRNTGPDECVQLKGAGTYRVDLVGNTFGACGGVRPVNFLDGATLAEGAIQIHNQGDTEPQAVPLRQLTTSLTWDPPVLADGASTGIDLALSGASPGDVASASFDSLTGGNWQITSYVSATNQVRVVLTNHTGNATDLPEGTSRVSVWKFK
jgi:hypothetical protein